MGSNPNFSDPRNHKRDREGLSQLRTHADDEHQSSGTIRKKDELSVVQALQDARVSGYLTITSPSDRELMRAWAKEHAGQDVLVFTMYAHATDSIVFCDIRYRPELKRHVQYFSRRFVQLLNPPGSVREEIPETVSITGMTPQQAESFLQELRDFIERRTQ